MTAIDPLRRRVLTDTATYDADFLVVALGADYDLAATPGFQEGGFEYYSLAGAERLRDVLADFEAGTVLISVLGHPFKCPPAPFEAAFLLHDLFVRRGVRDGVDIRMTYPMSAPVPVTKEVSHGLLAALDEREIHYAPKELVVGLDARARAARLASGGTVPYADDIAARLRRGEHPPPYEGAGTCYVEFGSGLVGKVVANFLGGPAPTARIIAPSRELATEKEAFAATRRQRWFGTRHTTVPAGMTSARERNQ